MNPAPYFIKLAVACACLGLSIFVVIQGEARINSQAPVARQAEETPAPADGEKDSAALLSELKKETTELEDAQKDFEKQKSDLTKQFQDDQVEINRGNQIYQFQNSMVRQLVNLTDESLPGGKKDDKLNALIPNDIVTPSTDPLPAIKTPVLNPDMMPQP